jgi:predicted TPR repeat methyltransferase
LIEGDYMERDITLTIDEAFDMALRLHKGGHHASAETLYRRIIHARPTHVDAMTYYGLLCHQQHRREEAAGLLTRVVDTAPDNADAHNNLGNVLDGLGRKRDAAVCYRNAIAIHPEHAPALNNLGVVLMADGRTDEALAAYEKAVAVAPETADYRYNLANALKKCRRLHEAVASYRRAVNLDPTHIGAWQGLARVLIESGQREAALTMFDEWLAKAPANPVALYLQAACAGTGAPGRAPDAFVQKTFDDMADTFDAHLVEGLGYRAPQQVLEAVARLYPHPRKALDILDAGCGTGLCGPLFKPYARRLVGVDLSAGMLIRARGDGYYDDLVQAELTEFLANRTGAFDLIIAADTLCYFGDLEPVIKGAAGRLKDGGRLVFTLEDAGSSTDGWQLNRHGRYAHTGKYVTTVLGAAGCTVREIEAVVLRNEGGAPVEGHLVTATFTRH